MVKICHMTSAHKRYDIRIFEKECVSLSKRGYEVVLLVNDDLNDEVKNNVKITSTEFFPKNRIDRFLNSNKKMLEKALLINADIYHFHDPDLLSLGYKIKKKGKIVIFDSHEDVPMQILDKDWIPKFIRPFISFLYGAYEKKVARLLDGIISVTPHVVERFNRLNEKSIMITNYPIIDFKENEKNISLHKEDYICFAGSISSQWMHENIITAIEDMPNIRYMLVGDGTEDYLNHLKTLKGWKNVNYVGKVPHEEVKKLYEKSKIGLALNFSTQAIKAGGTLGNTKLFEIMQNKLPVICTNYNLWKNVVEKFDCGICINPNNVEEIKEAIQFLLLNMESAYKMGQNGYKVVKELYNWSVEEKKLYEFYDLLLENKLNV